MRMKQQQHGLHQSSVLRMTKYANLLSIPPISGRSQVRFRDGMVVSTKGERFVVEKDMEWDGGSRGKVITRRGKGFR